MAEDLRFQKQTDLTNTTGNCFATCVACLIGEPVENVPNFVTMGDSWFDIAIQWLREKGWAVVYVCGPDRPQIEYPISTKLWAQVPYIVTGKSPRGNWLHSVIHFGGELLHDPHPNGNGVDSIVDYVVLLPTTIFSS